MRNFFELLKKEVRELLTPQLILPFVIMMIVFFMIGQFLEGEIEKIQEPISVTIVDQDDSDLTNSIPPLLDEAGYEVTVLKDPDVEGLKNDISTGDEEFQSFIVFPEGIQSDLENGKQITISTFTHIDSFSTVSVGKTASVESIVVSLNEVVSSQLISQLSGDPDTSFYKQPIISEHTVLINGKQAMVQPSIVLNYILSQVAIIPVILFLVITIAAQLVATAVATEKENKTLETLLASPINRKSIVATKLIAAGLISLLIAMIYMFGINNFTQSFTGTDPNLAEGSATVMESLGLNFSSSDFLILGVVIFLGILVALSLAFILGSFANDSRSAQSVIAPVMLMLLVPYLLTMLVDINSASTVVKALLYAIPFTYTFTAASNLMLDNYEIIAVGIIYNLILIAIFILIASKIFTSEKILTLRLPEKLLKR